MIDRRHFLRLSTGAALGLSVSAAHPREPSAPPVNRIGRYVRLGRTDLKVSDISFGSASSADPALVTHAFERGVNYFDTAESYKWGNAEEAIGEALRGKRLEVVLSTKTKAGSSDTSAEMMKALEGSLRRLKTDHVDIYFNHAVNDVERIAQSAMARVHRARQASRQDPLPRHVRSRQSFGRVPRLCHRQ